jgi:CrcB protein
MIASVLSSLAAGFHQIGQILSSVDPAIRAPIAISSGAIPGALSRYYLTLLAAKWSGTFPYGTFFINLT